jgi:hypothetical protein
LFSVWAGYAAVDILLKYSSSLGLQFAVTLNLTFIAAFILSIAYIAITQPNWQPKNIFTGLFLGVLNFANIALCQSTYDFQRNASHCFCGMNILVVVLLFLVAWCYLKNVKSLYLDWIDLWCGCSPVFSQSNDVKRFG